MILLQGLGLDERRANLLKRMSQEHEAAGVASVIGGGGTAASAALGGGAATTIHEPPAKMARHEREEEKESHHQQQQQQQRQEQHQQQRQEQQQQQQLPHSSLFMSPQEKIATASSPMQNVLTPIPHELTVNARQELRKYLEGYFVLTYDIL